MSESSSLKQAYLVRKFEQRVSPKLDIPSLYNQPDAGFFIHNN